MKNTLLSNKFWRRRGAAAFFCCILAGPWSASGVRAQEAPDLAVLTLVEAAELLRVDAAELERLARANEIPARQIGSNWRFNRAALLAWLNGEWSLIAAASPPDAPAGTSQSAAAALEESRPILSTTQMAQVTGAGAAPGAQNNDAPAQPIGEAPEDRSASDVFLRNQKVLLDPGEFVFEVGQFYARANFPELISVGNTIALGTFEQDSYTTLFQTRVGVFAETELFASTTINADSFNLHLDGESFESGSRTELGELNLGVRRTLIHEGPGRPDIIATVEAGIPTGETSFGIGGGLTMLKSVDPVVLFANANYRKIFSRNFSDLSRLEPGNIFDITLGYAMSLNDRLSVSTSVSGLFTSETRFGNVVLPRNDIFSMEFAMTSLLANGLYVEPSVSIGLSGPADVFAFGLTIPITPSAMDSN